MSVDFPSSTLPQVRKRSRSFSSSRRRKRSIPLNTSVGWHTLEVSFSLLDLHRTFLVEIDDAVLALGAAEQHHLLDDFRESVGLGADGAGARAASEGAHPAHHYFLAFAGQQRYIPLDRNQSRSPHHHFALLGEVQRHDGDVLKVNVLPDVQLRPVGKREDADALAGVQARVIEIPKLRALIFRIPLAMRVPEGIHALLGAGFISPASSASRSARVFRNPQHFWVPRSHGFAPASMAALFVCTISLAPMSAQKRSRNSIISRNL